jgi:hypothetical protein
MWYPPVDGWVRCYVMVDKQNCKYMRNDYHGLQKHASTSTNLLLNYAHTEYYDLSALFYSGTLDFSSHPCPSPDTSTSLVTLRRTPFSRTFHFTSPLALSTFAQTLHTLSTLLLSDPAGDNPYQGALADVRRVEKPKGGVKVGAASGKRGDNV